MNSQEQIMSRERYLSILPRQMETIVFAILQIFFAILAVLKIGEYHSDIPQFLAGENFRDVSD